MNSGSEANDLAMRLAQEFTRKKEFIVIEHAYHGHTCSVVGISPYKWSEKPDTTHVIPIPDTEENAARSVEELKRVVAERGGNTQLQ